MLISDDEWNHTNRETLEMGRHLELSLVELVVVASECSEDEMEIQDLVDGLIDAGQIQLAGV